MPTRRALGEQTAPMLFLNGVHFVGVPDARLVPRSTATASDRSAAHGVLDAMLAAADLRGKLARFFATRPEVVVAYLYGSHAEGRAHRESDIDVAVLLDRTRCPSADDRFRVRIDLGAELIAALHFNDIDLVVLNDAPPLFARHVVCSGTVVHCANPDAEHAYRRDVQLRAADLAPFIERGRRRLADWLAR
jgi:predicted nucleotidyltransferase